MLSKLGAGQGFSTLEPEVAYHRAMRSDTGTVRGEGEVMTMGRRAAFTEARPTSRAGGLCASATSGLPVTA